jgi:hypothetical protein
MRASVYLFSALLVLGAGCAKKDHTTDTPASELPAATAPAMPPDSTPSTDQAPTTPPDTSATPPADTATQPDTTPKP